MKTLALLAVALTAAVAALAAQKADAHPGDLWYDTAARTAQNIERKFPRIQVARCFAMPRWMHQQYDADSIVRGSVRMWDHFLCVLKPGGADFCFVVAHMTGREWWQLVLTSAPYRGCTPYVLR